MRAVLWLKEEGGNGEVVWAVAAYAGEMLETRKGSEREERGSPGWRKKKSQPGETAAVNWERDSVWLRRVVWGRKKINVGAGGWFLREEH